VPKGLDSLKVIPFTRDRVPNEYPGGDLPWQMYHGVRNALVQTCRRYGPTGPMGVVKIATGSGSRGPIHDAGREPQLLGAG